jgi:hypothetical protein
MTGNIQAPLGIDPFLIRKSCKPEDMGALSSIPWAAAHILVIAGS